MLDLVGVNAKIDRAMDNLRSLENDIGAYCQLIRHQIIFDERQPFMMDVGDHPGLPTDYAIRVGEVAYNLRSALDHLVWELVEANGKNPSRHTEFPIFAASSLDPSMGDSLERWARKTKRQLKGLNENQRQSIYRFQPFHPENEIGLHLDMLSTICNIDKHRHLNVFAGHSSADMTVQELNPIVDVCFMDDEIEDKKAAIRGYGSQIEREGVKRPPVASVLWSCLLTVSYVVRNLSQNPWWLQRFDQV